jgi:phosphate:Na+ symporter
MTVASLIQVFGGLAVFLLGIDMLGAGMEQLAAKQIQAWLDRMTDRPLKAAAFGFVATAVLQSSSLLMVTMIGLINAHLFTLEQAVGVMMGQEIGTTLTAQLVAFDIGPFLFALLIVGYIMRIVGKERRWLALGTALLGVGLIFLSLDTMKAGIKPLVDQPHIQAWLVAMGRTPILGVLAGTALTGVIQSSSAVTSLTVALGISNAITLPGAIGIILGANIGTCVTGLIAALRSSPSSRRASLAQILINLFGVALFLPFISPFAALLARSSSNLGRQIANAHSVFNIVVSLVLFPFIPVIVHICKTLIPGEEPAPTLAQYLDDNMLRVPTVALTGASKEVVRVGNLARDMLDWSRDALLQGNEANIERVLQCEAEQIDPLCRAIEQYIDRLTRGSLNESERERCFQLKHVITDVERVADMAENMAQAGQERLRESVPFSSQADAELLQFHKLVTQTWALAVKAVETDDEATARAVEEREEEIDAMERQLRDAHRQRLEEGVCTPKADILFVETLRNLERIGDHADNLSISVLHS